MKGFLSLLGITLIVAACGLILLSYSDVPLEELKSQERMNIYMETRQNHAGEDSNSGFSLITAEHCENPLRLFKKADSD